MTGMEILPPLINTSLFTKTNGSCAPRGNDGQSGSNKLKYSTSTFSLNCAFNFPAAHSATSRQESFTPSLQAMGAPMICTMAGSLFIRSTPTRRSVRTLMTPRAYRYHPTVKRDLKSGVVAFHGYSTVDTSVLAQPPFP